MAPAGETSSLSMGLSGQATARAISIAITVVGALGAMWLSVLDHRFALGWRAWPPNAFTLPGHLFWSAAAGAIGTVAVILLRQPKGAKLTWDAWGVHEWDGDGVRVAIPFAKLKVGSMLTLMKRKHSFRPGMPIGSFVTLGDGGDRRIYLTMGTQLAWLADRRVAVDTMDPLLARLGEVDAGPVDLGRGAENALAGWWVLGIAGYVAAALALTGLCQPHSVAFPAREVLLGACGLLVLRALQPFFRWLRLRKEDARFSGATALTLTANEGTVVNATTADGRPMRFDVAPLNHPDGAIETRRGPAFAVLAGGTCAALETEGIRRARQHRKRASLLEAGLRVAGAALLAVCVI